MIAFLSLVASATNVQQEFCFSLDTDYDELILYGTWWTTNTIRPYRGVRISVCDSVVWWSCVAAFTEDTGSDAGCTTLSLDDQRSYNVRVYDETKVRGRKIYAVDDESDDESDVGSSIQLVSFVPYAGTEDVTLSHDTRRGAILVASWIFYRNSFGLSASGHPLKIVVDGSGPTNANKNRILVHTDAKRSISHEVGHWIGMRRDEISSINHNGNAPEFNCQGWATNDDDLSREWDSRAASEGWADFVAAWAWNTRNSSACALHRERATLPDWDLDFDDDSPFYAGGAQGQWGCEGDPNDFNSDGDLTDPGEPQWSGFWNTSNYDPPWSYLTARDWLEDMVTGSDPMGCTGTLYGVSSKVDWVRFWWDMTTDENLTPRECADIFDLANPKNWDATPSGSQGNDPIRRIESAADSLGFGAAFDNQKSNGLDHY